MASPLPLTRDECNAAVSAFLDRHMGMVHRDDVGPLFGQLATICSQAPLADATTRKSWCDAVTVALAGDRRGSGTRQDFAPAAFSNAASSRIASAMSWT